VIDQHEVATARFTPEVDGLRIAHLSDLHVRTGIKPRRLHRAVEIINALRPDMVVLTGDYVCYSPRPVRMLTEALRALEVPAYAVLGNHDHWSGAPQVRQALGEAGVDVLTNESRRVHVRGGGTLHLVGVDDCITHHHDPDAAFADVPEGASTVVLSHDPRSADFLHTYRPGLVLSGHTHGGQFFFKRLTPLVWRKTMGVRYLTGFYDVEGTRLFVNRGFGAAIPVRVNARAEVTLLTLRSEALARAGTGPLQSGLAA
jgi:predicted MPP superfamily phosphohydrolase